MIRRGTAERLGLHRPPANTGSFTVDEWYTAMEQVSRAAAEAAERARLASQCMAFRPLSLDDDSIPVRLSDGGGPYNHDPYTGAPIPGHVWPTHPGEIPPCCTPSTPHPAQ